MAQAATLPPLPQAPPQSKARPQVREMRLIPLEERLSVLETHSLSLATKADVRGTENRMILWMIGTGVALIGVFVALLTSNSARTDAALAANSARTDAALGEIRADQRAMSARMDAALGEIKADQRTMSARIDRLDEKLDARFDALTARLDAIMAELRAQNRAP